MTDRQPKPSRVRAGANRDTPQVMPAVGPPARSIVAANGLDATDAKVAAVSATADAKVSPPPSDGNYYAYLNGAWTRLSIAVLPAI